VQVLQAWKQKEVRDAAAFSEKTRGWGVSRVVLGTVQVGTDILAAYCCSVTAGAFGSSSSFGAQAIGFVFQLLFFYFATGAFLDLFRLGAVIGTAAGLGANSKTLYAAIEELAGEASGLAVVDKAQAAVSSAKVVLALNSVRRILKVRCTSFTLPFPPEQWVPNKVSTHLVPLWPCSLSPRTQYLHELNLCGCLLLVCGF
jgi:hypothetical protein